MRKDFRSKKLGLALYKKLLCYAEKCGLKHLILDTPSVAKQSHKFYEKAGFYIITKQQLPVEYDFPDRNSLIYMLDLQ